MAMTSNPLPVPEKRKDGQIKRFLRDDRTGIVALNAVMTFLLLGGPYLNPSRWSFRLEFVGFLLIGAALSLAAIRNKDAAWVKAVSAAGHKTGVTALEAWSSFQSDKRAKGIIFYAGFVLILACVQRLVYSFIRYGGLAEVVFYSLMVALVVPAASVIGLLLARKVTISPEEPHRLIEKVNRNFAITTRKFLIKRNPYLCAYAGFGLFCAIAALAPNGLGWTFAGWFTSLLYDANISNDQTVSPLFQLLVSIGVGLLAFNTIQKIAVRLSAGFQLLSVRMLIHRDGALEALMNTTNVQATKIELPEAHPHLSNICNTLIWLVFCYIFLFYLIAFCPGPLGTSISNWINASILDAGINLQLYAHENLRLFLASIVASTGAVPFAVMSSVFLPLKGPDCLIVSEKGILSPQISNPLQAPLKQWEDLKSVSLTNAGKSNETIKMSFKNCGSIKLKTRDLEKQKIAELMATADEYATQCKFDADSIALRSRLAKENCAGSHADQAKFTSTIFSTKQSGDFLHDLQYRIVRKIAGKPLCAVYLARDQENTLVVIKEFVLPTCVKQTEEMKHSFDREFKALSSIKHHSIARVIETFEEDEAKYIVLEHINGEDLRTIVQKRGKRDEPTVVRWAEQIANLMQLLHAQTIPILHRDLTPDNLMEDADGNLKLIDFGAAHQFMEGVTGTLIGKQCYIAPEQLRGQPSIQSDIYSFGCTLYFLLAGTDPQALEQSVLDPSQVEVRPWLNELIKKCTEFDSENRYRSFDEIIQAIKLATARRSKTLKLISKTASINAPMELENVEHS